ncbi:MAG: aminotransferase class I/II-fold pyridoxal phosphate-dependent enzyme [Methanobacteriota archaeon]|nr:MAG: aminotransferase class I/II-fold pyridoxal phosphate-dependent enzyme [Euryarchaeota archaeon]
MSVIEGQEEEIDVFSTRLDGIEKSGIRKIFGMADEKSIHLGIGEPDFNPPPHIAVALKEAVDAGYNKYSPILGLPELREAIVERMKRYKSDITMDNVMVTMGASSGLALSSMAFYEPGDEILFPDPGFVFYKPHSMIYRAKPVCYALKHEHGYVPQPDEINELVTEKTKAIIVNSPSNPCGSAFPKEVVRGIIEIAEDNNIVIISDEVYDEIIYEGEHHSFLGDYENVVCLNSFSKTFAMTGWRIGYMVSSPDIIEHISRLQYYAIACPSTPLERAVLAGLHGPLDFIQDMVQAFRRRRDVIVDRLNNIDGFDCLKPHGAFYVFPSYDFKINDTDLAIHFLEAGVVSTYGSAFGKRGQGHIRFSYANSVENIEKGMDIVSDAVADLERN